MTHATIDGLSMDGAPTLKVVRQRLDLPAGEVRVGDRLVLPMSGRDYPVFETATYDDGTLALHWREREPGEPWLGADWRTKTEPERSGTFHRAPDAIVTVLR